MHLQVGKHASHLARKPDILDDGPVDAATPRLAYELKRPLLFARKDLHVDGEIDPDPAQVREIACLPKGFEREIPRVPARIEIVEAEIGRIGSGRHGRAKAFSVSSWG